MIEKIRQTVMSGQFDEALSMIEKEIKKINSRKSSEDDERNLQELIALRVTANTLALKNDEAVVHSVHKLKYPYTETIELSNKGKVVLMDSDIFFVESDAYLNLIPDPKQLKTADRSFTNSLKKRIGLLSTDDFKKHKKNDSVYLLSHPELSAPFSYHIAAKDESNKIDKQLLAEGILFCLKDALEKNLERVSFPALGMDTLLDPTEKKSIIDTVVKTIDKFFGEVVGANNIEILFPFINMSSFTAFKEGFMSYTPEGRVEITAKQSLDDSHSILVEKTRTKNKEYIEKLRHLASYITEDRIILFLGETGVGKSYLAQQSHYLSPRRNKNFEVLNCSMVTPEQLFTLVFGWGKEVFAGSPKGGMSIFEKANGGTVFFDEIGYTNKHFQTSLLNFLDNRDYKKAGDQGNYYANVRLMFGTNQDLEKQVKEGKFVNDLYERISSQRVFKISPLRERPEDISSFVIGEINQLNQKIKSDDERKDNESNEKINIDESALNLLSEKSWPGNYRQLKNYIQNIYYDVRNNKKALITIEDILQSPPRDYQLLESNSYLELELLLTEVMSKWDSENYGKFKNDYIDPLISKVFLENLNGKYKKSNAPQFLGMDYRDNRLEKLSEVYKELLKKLK